LPQTAVCSLFGQLDKIALGHNGKKAGHSWTSALPNPTYLCWMLSAGANPAFIASQMGHENAEMVYTVYSAWISALAGDQIDFLNQRFGGYINAP